MTGIEKVYWIIYLSLGCIVPIILIIVSYTQIISTIRQTKENLTQVWFQSFLKNQDCIFEREFFGTNIRLEGQMLTNNNNCRI